MDNKALSDTLTSLMQLDFDAAQAYDEAIKRIPDEDRDIRDALSDFRNDHNRHVLNLSRAIGSLGGQPPQVSKDIKGRVIEGMTALMSAVGTHASLKAMQQNEHLTNKTYSGAVSGKAFTAYPDDVKVLLQNNYKDEQRHLSYIEAALQRVPAGAR